MINNDYIPYFNDYEDNVGVCNEKTHSRYN